MRGAELPSRDEIARAAGRSPHRVWEHEVSDDWRQRRVDDYQPELIAGRLHVRPVWAPSAPGAEIEIVLAEAPAFGGGTHPTTRTCLELLLSLEPRGSFADLGCGTGVLAILAAKLGFAPVSAIDVQPAYREAAAANAVANASASKRSHGRSLPEAPPRADVIAANVPAGLHAEMAMGSRTPFRTRRSSAASVSRAAPPCSTPTGAGTAPAPPDRRQRLGPWRCSSETDPSLPSGLRCATLPVLQSKRTELGDNGMADYIKWRLTAAKLSVSMALRHWWAGSPPRPGSRGQRAASSRRRCSSSGLTGARLRRRLERDRG